MNIFRLVQLACFFTASVCSAGFEPNVSEENAMEVLREIHSNFTGLHYGSFNEEYPEQVMSVMFISPTDYVLELGGNIGRNSCVIGRLLDNSENLVVLESDPGIAGGLIKNRDYNKLSFQVESAAISKVPLIQAGWVTVPNETLPAGHIQVNTITYDELKQKYALPFNVLVADCEGALYYILKDDESILDDVEMLILENDYHHRVHYDAICKQFIAHGFEIAYTKAGGWGPCYNEFYQVWKKKIAD